MDHPDNAAPGVPFFGKNFAGRPPSVEDFHAVAPLGDGGRFSHCRLLRFDDIDTQLFLSSADLPAFPVTHNTSERKLPASELELCRQQAAQFIYDVQLVLPGHVAHLSIHAQGVSVFAEAQLNATSFFSILNKKREGRRFAVAVLFNNDEDVGKRKTFEVLEV